MIAPTFARVTQDGEESLIVWRFYHDTNDFESVDYPLYATDLKPEEIITSVCNTLDNDLEDENYHSWIGMPKILTDIVEAVSDEHSAAEFAIRVYERGGLLP